MKYSISLLKEFYKTDKSIDEIADLITSLGSEVESIKDDTLETEVTPNRGDLLSHFGLARDLAAASLKKLDKPRLKLKEEGEKATNQVSVEIKSDLCPFYLARVIKGVKVGPSPAWMCEKLIACGAKPINNIVDITNYVMLEFGQPLHAFDAGKIEGGQIFVREVEKNEEVVTLDDQPRELLPKMLVISDSKRPIAIAGVMGLKNSEVDDSTVDIVLEAAVFDRKSIRKTSKLLGLVTAASYRFERGVDDGGVEYALDRAAQLILEIAGGKILQGVVKAGKASQQIEIDIEYEKINRLVGQNFSKEKVDKILQSLGCKIESGKAIVPSWRHDLEVWQDLVEEVARINGLEKIKPEPLKRSSKKPKASNFHKKEAIKDFLAGLGLDEVLNYSFLSQDDVVAAKIDAKNLVEVANPVQEENRYLRNSLIPGLLKSIARNPSFDDIEIFEVGNVFSAEGERTNLAIATSGKSTRKASAIVKEFCREFGILEDEFKIYEIDRDELERFKVKKPSVSVAEIDLSNALLKMKFKNLSLNVSERDIKYRPISKFPPVKRDLAFVVDRDVSALDIKNSILDVSPMVILAELFDEFSSDRFGVGKKNVAYHIWLESPSKTLSDSEADEQIKKIILKLEEKFGAKLRDS
jgi:phenylalanyl-tRNA synthetase beta chain